MKPISNKNYLPYTPLDFSEIDQQAQNFADIIEARFDALADILLGYESYDVVEDEIARTLDLLRSLKENKNYFKLRVGAVTAFLPRNQPLYAFTCFVIVPSLMASEVCFRIPNSMRKFFPAVLKLLEISKLFPNIVVSSKHRTDFLEERSALLVDPKTKKSIPTNDVVIFTGTSVHADQLRLIFDKQTLFISNGSGHNPIVVGEDASLKEAVEAVITLQFYNQGQDCAAPNSILVHKNILPDFLGLLHKEVAALKIGDYKDKSCRIGPISDPKDLVRIQDFLVEYREWLDPVTKGIIRTNDVIVEPTIICKPLSVGGNFKEIFAPIIFVQEYKQDSDLEYYFEDSRYAPNAMYVTLYGTSKYVENLIDRPILEKVLHKKSSLLHNTHLHAPGMERGTQSYGGYGYGASSVSLDDKIIPMPTLPQRDIYEFVALRKKVAKINQKKIQNYTEIKYKNIQKLLKLKNYKPEPQSSTEKFDSVGYLDTHSIKANDGHYVEIGEEKIFYLLKNPNAEYIAGLKAEESTLVHELNLLLKKKSSMLADEFRNLLYAIPKKQKITDAQNKILQSNFFRHIYQLLFGKESGPRLVPFLYHINNDRIKALLDV